MKKFSIGASFAILAVVAFGLVFRNDIHDYLKLRNYTPSKAIVELADATTMQSDARRLFYVNHPVIADSEEFNSTCRENEHSIVLGCYLTGQRGIYLLHVTDERLAGIQEVTAAHELLHAAYERLSIRERNRVDVLLADVFASITDTRVKETIELYRRQDPAIVPNELHSILGTEVRVLSAELETYYARYFKDRQRIVSFAEAYEQAFIERRNIIRQYDAELTSLKQRIDALSLQLSTDETQLRALRQEMEGYRSAHQIERYNELVPIFNGRVAAYNTEVDELSALVARYNDTVQKRNGVAAEEAELVDAIDSRDVVPKQQ